MKRIIYMTIISALIFSCKGKVSETAEEEAINTIREFEEELAAEELTINKDTIKSALPPEQVFIASLSASEKTKVEKEIAKCVIASLYYVSPGNVRVKEVDDYYVGSYGKNGNTYSTKVRVGGGYASWGNADGRWRNDPADESVYYSLNNGEINIRVKFSDGSSDRKTYKNNLIKF